MEQKISIIKINSENIVDRFIEYSAICLKGGWVLDEENKETETVIECLVKDEVSVLLLGNPGAGKTIMMEMLRNIINPAANNYFIIINAIDFVLRFNKEGHKIFDLYQDKNVLIDDLGTEEMGYFFKERSEAIGLFLLFRYNLFKRKGVKTHLTSNLTPKEIEARYGLRVSSRIKETCDTFKIGATSTYTDRRIYRNFINLPKVFYLTPAMEEEKRIREGYKNEIKNPKPSASLSLGAKLRESLGTINKQTNNFNKND